MQYHFTIQLSVTNLKSHRKRSFLEEKIKSVPAAVLCRRTQKIDRPRLHTVRDCRNFRSYALCVRVACGAGRAGGPDVENETAVQEALSRLVKDKTVLIIAHRMRTVAGADKIVVLADGHVAEQGTPQSLFERNGIYANMDALQTESHNWVLAK